MNRAPAVWIASLVSLLIGGLVASLSYSGFCFCQRRFLSDGEYIDTVVDHLIALRTHQLVVREAGLVRMSSVTVIPYRNRTDFIERNPGCCRVFNGYFGDEFVPPTYGRRLMGRAAANVAATYVVSYLDETGVQQQTTATSRMTVTNCGSLTRNY